MAGQRPVTRWELAQAIAAGLNKRPGFGGIRANAWKSPDGRLVSVYLAGGKSGLRLGRIDVDGQLRLTARGDSEQQREAARAWLGEAEQVRAWMLPQRPDH